jgi:hypothetical protein
MTHPPATVPDNQRFIPAMPAGKLTAQRAAAIGAARFFVLNDIALPLQAVYQVKEDSSGTVLLLLGCLLGCQVDAGLYVCIVEGCPLVFRQVPGLLQPGR